MAALDNFAEFSQFPTGLPPFLNVSLPSDFKRARMIIISHAPFSRLSVLQPDSRRRFVGRSDLGRDGHDRRHPMLHLCLILTGTTEIRSEFSMFSRRMTRGATRLRRAYSYFDGSGL